MKRPAALAWSIALHAAVLYGLSRVPWRFAEPVPGQPSVVVWLRNPPPVKPVNRHASEAKAAPSLPQAPSAANRPHRAAGSSSQAPAAARGVKAAPAHRPSAAASSRGASGGRSGAPDLERLLHRAVAAVSRQRRRERGYRTFSLRDLPERGGRAGIPGPKPPPTSVFRYGSQGSQDSGRWLAYNEPARTKIGRWLADTCHVLTDGGLGMFGFMDLCAENHAHGDLFESLEPPVGRHAEGRKL